MEENFLSEIKKIQNFFNSKFKYSLAAIHISAAITAYARINLDKKKREIITEGGEIYYSDTDSIVTDLMFSESVNMGD